MCYLNYEKVSKINTSQIEKNQLHTSRFGEKYISTYFRNQQYTLMRSNVCDKVTKILTNLVSNNILYKLSEYNDACDLWSKLVKLHEDPSLTQNKDKLKKGG